MNPAWILGLVVGSVAGLYAVAALIARFSSDGRSAEALRQMPRTAAAAAAEGERVKVVGVVALRGQELIAPHSHTRCCSYVAVLPQTEYGEGGAVTTVRALEAEENACDFFVEDETGRALVRPGDGYMRFLPRVVRAVGAATPEGLAPEEWTLAPGDPIAVVGVARYEPDADADADARAPGGYRHAPLTLVLDDALLMEP